MAEQIPSSPPLEKGAGNRAVRRCLQVMKYLGQGDILAWRSMRQIAQEMGITASQTYTALEDLVREELVEKSATGYRQGPQGLAFYAIAAQEAVARAVYQAGFRNNHHEKYPTIA